ncbi:MAG: response regulator [Longimicrobiales bacterium]
MTGGATDDRLRAIFLEEYREHAARLRALVGIEASDGGTDAPGLEEAERRAHSLKGAARAVGLDAVQEVAHRLEDTLAEIREGERTLDRSLRRGVSALLDQLDDHMERDGVIHVSEPTRALDTAAEGTPRPPDGTLRVDAGHLDLLIDRSADLLAEAGHAVTLNDLDALIRSLTELQATLRRSGDPDGIRNAARCLQRARDIRLAERDRAARRRRSAQQVRRVTRSLGTVAVSEEMGWLRRAIRETAHDEGRDVQAVLRGTEVRADRSVLQRLREPLLHLVRNAVAHGAEAAEDRLGRGLPAATTVEVAFEAHRGRLRVTVSDDGRGLDEEAILAAAGYEPSPGDDADRARRARGLIFRHGLSTRERAGHSAGRGVGMSVVAQAVRRLQGEISVAPGPDAGTTVALEVPLHLSAHRLLVLEAGGVMLAVPSVLVHRVVVEDVAGLPRTDGVPRLAVEGDIEPLPIHELAELVGRPGAAPRGPCPVLLLRGAQGRAGVAVDRIHSVRDELVRPLPGGAARPLSLGTAVLGGDTPVAVVDPTLALAQWSGTPVAAHAAAPEREAQRSTPTVLVVDDSLTTRALEQGILESAGYRVLVAVNGRQALRTLATESVDLVVSDLQMPVLDGFGFLEELRADPRWSGLPFIMVTSVETPAERDRAHALGADAYIVKLRFEQGEFLRAVERCL